MQGGAPAGMAFPLLAGCPAGAAVPGVPAPPPSEPAPAGIGFPLLAGCPAGAAVPGVPAPPPMDPAGQMQAAAAQQAMMFYQQMQMQQQQHLQIQQQQQALQQPIASQLTLQAAQAYDASVQEKIDPEVQELAHHFKLDERITKDLDVQMKTRKQTFDDDLTALWEILEGARHPAGLLRVKIREMEEGSFRGTATPDRAVEDAAKKFNLDAQASAKLAEVLGKRDDRKKDLRQICKHLELSNKPSSLVMLMLKDLRAGLPVKDPEYPPAVGSYAHKQGLKRGGRSRSREKRRRRSDSSSSSPPPGQGTVVSRSSGAGPLPQKAPRDGETRAMTLLERFG